MFCPQCRHSNDAAAKYCTSCGIELPKNVQDLEAASDPQEFYRAVIGPKSQAYYLRQFDRFDAQGKAGISWHWPSLFVSFYWFLYRKMWLAALIYFFLPYLVMVPLGIAAAITGKSGENLIIFGYLLYIVAILIIPPMYANALYYKHCKKKIAETRASSNMLQRQLGELSGKGGTSNVVLIFVLIFFFVAFIGILAAIAIPAYQDYTTRARVAQAEIVGNSIASSVSEFYERTQQVPSSLREAGFLEPLPAIIADIGIAQNGVISIAMASAPIAGKTFFLIPAVDTNGKIVWTCSSKDIANKYLPQHCRQNQ